MIISFDIPNTKLQRISDALDREGFVFVPGQGTTRAEQKKAYFKKLTIDYWKSIMFNHERAEAIANEPNDTAALQAARVDGLDDVIVTEE